MSALRRAGAAAAIAALALSTVAAADGGTAPTVSATGVRAAGFVTVTGSATAGADLGNESINGFVTDFADTTAGGQAGLQLQDALISQDDEGVTFTWVVSNLNAPPPPEGARYNWSFAIDGSTFQLQAKTTNLVGTTVVDDPAGHATNAGASFQVRGNCETEWMGTPVSNCPHIGWASGSFDTANNQVTMTVPFDFHEKFQSGVTIVEHQSATMSVAASGQAAVSNTSTSSYINEWSSSYATGLVVYLHSAAADANPDKFKGGVPVEVAADGSFTGEIEVDEDQIAWVRACSGFTCAAQPLV